jgi:hypothetical protein
MNVVAPLSMLLSPKNTLAERLKPLDRNFKVDPKERGQAHSEVLSR